MPRHSRIVLADCAHHVTERGNQRATVFDTDDDRAVYLHLVHLRSHGSAGERKS